MEAQIERTLGDELRQACQNGSLDDTRRIISQKEASDPLHKVPFPELLYKSLEKDNLHITQFCLEHGATVTDTMLKKIMICRATNTYTYLLASRLVDINHYIPWWGDVLSNFVLDNDLEGAQLCLSHGADPNKNLVDEYQSILSVAAEAASLDMVKLLVEQGGARVKGSGALIMAAQRGKLAMAEYLLAHGADIDENPADERFKEDEGSALHRAVYSGHRDLVDFLIQKGPNRDSRDMMGRTPMDVARARGDAVIQKMLEE